MRRCIKRWATENREASPRHLPGGRARDERQRAREMHGCPCFGCELQVSRQGHLKVATRASSSTGPRRYCFGGQRGQLLRVRAGPSVLQAASCLNPGAQGRTPSLKLAHCRMTHQQPVLCLDPSSEQFREPADGSHARCFLVPIEVHSDADRALQPACQVAAEEPEAY